QPARLPPLQALSRGADAREDGPGDHGPRRGGPGAVPRSSTGGAGVRDAVVGESPRLYHQGRLEARAAGPTARPDPDSSHAGLRRADRSVVSAAAAAGARGDERAGWAAARVAAR